MRGSLPTHSHTSFNLAGSIKQTNKVLDVFALSVVSGSYWQIFWVKLCDADEKGVKHQKDFRQQTTMGAL